MRARQQAAGLFPLFFDDVGPNRIGGTSGEGVKIVKAQDQRWKAGEQYPCIIASLNSETHELIPEVRKRSHIVYADSPLALDDIKKTNQLRREAQRIHNRIGTSFYREYLYRMDQRLPTDDAELAELDYLSYSSKLIMGDARGAPADGRIPARVVLPLLRHSTTITTTGTARGTPSGTPTCCPRSGSILILLHTDTGRTIRRITSSV